MHRLCLIGALLATSISSAHAQEFSIFDSPPAVTANAVDFHLFDAPLMVAQAPGITFDLIEQPAPSPRPQPEPQPEQIDHRQRILDTIEQHRPEIPLRWAGSIDLREHLLTYHRTTVDSLDLDPDQIRDLDDNLANDLHGAIHRYETDHPPQAQEQAQAPTPAPPGVYCRDGRCYQTLPQLIRYRR